MIRTLTFIGKKSDQFPVSLCIQRERDATDYCPDAHRSDSPSAQRVDGLIAVWSYVDNDVNGPTTWNGIPVTGDWRMLSWVAG